MRNVCRIIVLCVAVTIAGYMVMQRHGILHEAFEASSSLISVDAQSAPYYETIKTIIQTYLLRSPEQFEYERYRKLMNHSKDVDPVIEAVKKTQEFLDILSATKKTDGLSTLAPVIATKGGAVEALLEQTSIDKRTIIYRQIIEVYDRHLQRMPTMRELNYYSYRMLTDDKFTVRRLDTILQSSKEFEILTKNQSNLVQAELPLHMTDRQVAMEVGRLYAGVFGEGVPTDMEEFLKRRYIQYELKEKRFIEFLMLLKALESDQVDIKRLADGSIGITASAGKAADMNGSILQIIDEPTTTVSDTVPMDTNALALIQTLTGKQALNAEAQAKAILLQQQQQQQQQALKVQQSPTQIFNIISPTDAQMKSLLKQVKASGPNVSLDQTINLNQTGDDSGYEHVTHDGVPATMRCGRRTHKDPLYESLQRFQKQMNPKDNYADYLEQRNIDELETSCARNTYYLNVDDDMVIVPKMEREDASKLRGQRSLCGDVSPMTTQTALIGTLLPEASNTKVGSILPRFLYKETGF